MGKRILFLTPGLTKGGAETQLIRVSAHLKTQGKEVVILALRPLNNFEPQIKEHNLEVVFLKEWKHAPLNNIKTIIHTFSRFKPEVVIAFMFIAIIFARLLKLKFKYHLVSSIRNSVIAGKWRKAFQVTSGLDDIVIYNSRKAKENFERQKLVRKKGIVINNAVKIPVRPAYNRSGSERSFTWVTMAHFRVSKDYETLFKAISIIKSEDFKILIFGHIGNQKWPYERVKELEIGERVKIMGFNPNAVEYLKEADAFVLSSFWEGSPNAMLEAMSYCKPIVGSAVDGIEELLSDANCGYLSKPGNAEDLANNMLHIMKMPPCERIILGQKGRDYIEEYFSEAQVMEKWMEVIG